MDVNGETDPVLPPCDPAPAGGTLHEGPTADPDGSGASLTHAVDAFRERVGSKDPRGGAVPQLHRWVDVSLETSLVHCFKRGFEAWLPAIMVNQAIALGTQEGDRGGGEPIATSFTRSYVSFSHTVTPKLTPLSSTNVMSAT